MSPALPAGGRLWTILAALAAALTAGLVMLALRWTLQVRSVPERVLEWLLLFIPLDVFESILQVFGFNAKRYALYLGILVALGGLTWLGAVALGRRWPPRVLMEIGFALWLFTMVVIMPVTSAGFFAMALLEGTQVTVVGYLGTALVYAAVLSLARVVLFRPTPDTSRRWALSLMGGSGAVLAGAFLLDAVFPHRTGLPTIVIADPQEPVPSGGVDVPNPHPNPVGSPVTAAASDIPARDAHLVAGAQRIAGVAYAGDRGIQKVEFSTDGRRTWQTAALTEPAAGRDVWVRWQGRFSITAGAELTLVARSTDGGGALQPEPFSLAQPDGAAGWNTITVRGA